MEMARLGRVFATLTLTLTVGAFVQLGQRAAGGGGIWAGLLGAEQLGSKASLALAVRTAQAAALEPMAAALEPMTAALSGAPANPSGELTPAWSITLLGLARETPIYARPSKEARKIGYVRTGASLSANPEKLHGAGCAAWHAVRPFGFVCVDERVSLSTHHPVAEFATRLADRTSALPYSYARVKQAGVPLYTRVPSADEREQFEGLRFAKLDRAWHAADVEPLPLSLAQGRSTPTLHGYARPRSTLYSERTLARGSFAIVRSFESEGRLFGLTPDLLLLPLDRVTPLNPSVFHGVKLGANQTLPVAFVMSKSAYLYSSDTEHGTVRLLRRLEFREGIVVKPNATRRIAGKEYLQSVDGGWFRADQVRLITSAPEALPWLKRGQRFLDISLRNQSLVAYEQGRPVFATLISSGLGSDKPGSTARATVVGQFRTHTKHVTAPMSGDDLGDEYSLPDVPYVQYFHGNFALHAAYWHDAFGTPKSHGCVNLSPADARFLFGWTEPPVPQAWHGAMDPAGTRVSIHE